MDPGDSFETLMGLVPRVLAGFRHRPEDAEDLLQEGRIGLLDAVRTYTASVRIGFRQYAIAKIRYAILGAMRRPGLAIVHVPLRTARKRRAAGLSAAPGVYRLGDQPEKDSDPESRIEARERDLHCERIHRARGHLLRRQNHLLDLRYGKNLSLADASRRLGIEPSLARSLEHDALARIREAVDE